RLGDGNRAAPGACALDDRRRAVGRRRPELEPPARRAADGVDRAGEHGVEPGKLWLAGGDERAGARREGARLPDGRPGVAPRGYPVVDLRAGLEAGELRVEARRPRPVARVLVAR